jgi:Winged helix-turn helix
VQHEVHIDTIYRLLHRHGWRKLAPRARHPKANQEEQDAFQKNRQGKECGGAAAAQRSSSEVRKVSRW